jgi:4-alpha-glucanotransferase
MTRSISDRQVLRRLARAWGIQTSYTDAEGRRRHAHDDALLGALRARGAPVESLADVRDALRERETALAARTIEPAVVAWDGRMPRVPIRMARGVRAATCTIETEDGDRRTWDLRLRNGRGTIEVHDRLPLGRHALRVEAGSNEFRACILSAPRQACTIGTQRWGAFAPVYALAREGACHGTYTELHELARAMRDRGAGLVATLPIHAAFLDAPFDPSPYAPASRLFWNELYVDPRAFDDLRGDGGGDELSECGRSAYVDYRAAAAAHRRLLQPAADRLLGPDGDADAKAFAARPDVIEYARFRAVVDTLRTGWHEWPPRLRNGRIRDGDFDPSSFRYHAFVQWAAERQLSSIAADPEAADLYLDMPLGVHPDSYDTWRYRSIFASAASAGAPPDALFSGGQDWGFPPMDPDALRADGYAYLAAALRHQFRYAAVVRLDHVMSLHRLYWIPHGLPPTEGVYVRYPEDEMFALLTLESMRARGAVVGEDLGTVAASVRRRMARHAIHRMFVVQYEVRPDAKPVLPAPPALSAASLNTHDMPTFTGFWQERDIADMRDLGMLDEAGAEAARRQRARLRRALARHVHLPERAANADDPGPVMDALLERLASGPAAIVLVGLEDLWLEPDPQNVPGTGSETRPNWRRRFRYPFPDVLRRGDVSRRLDVIAEARSTASSEEQE